MSVIRGQGGNRPRPDSDAVVDLNRIYTLLDRLRELPGGYRYLCCCTGRMAWPARGVYFSFEPREAWTDG
ncbi:hypothetical protein DSECCO2_607420 [anaerobic digester metagenome]